MVPFSNIYLGSISALFFTLPFYTFQLVKIVYLTNLQNEIHVPSGWNLFLLTFFREYLTRACKSRSFRKESARRTLFSRNAIYITDVLILLPQGIVTYHMTSSVLSEGACLDNNHSHFILVDDGTVGKYGGEISFRASLQNCISSKKITRSESKIGCFPKSLKSFVLVCIIFSKSNVTIKKLVCNHLVRFVITFEYRCDFGHFKFGRLYLQFNRCVEYFRNFLEKRPRIVQVHVRSHRTL